MNQTQSPTRTIPSPAPDTASDPLWYKDAVIYQLHVKSFADSNADGIGDFAGLIGRLDHIVDLGVTAVWLLPFYPSPRRDDGYDIASYEEVSADYGTMDELRAFIDAAHARGLRIITELVINHTSDQHAWFQAARHAPKGSAARDFYVWSDDPQLYSGTRIIFLDTEKSNWTWDEVAGQYFWHRFYSHQPDLNFDNPEVLAQVLRVMHFWLDLGIDGLRLDAIPYLIERDGTSNENLPETHEVLKKIRADLDAHYPDRMLLAEANMWPEDTQQYFGSVGPDGKGDECQMAFHFPLMPRMYMAVAQEDRFPITDIMHQTPQIPPDCQWAIFLRNHDELTLEMVTDAERDYLWNTYAADRRARINLGIRRRLAPLMERDRRRIELMNALLLSMPGTPVLYYGDEIGMGDNVYLGDRDGVRTPMQWSSDRNGGFSRADPQRLTLPVIQDPLYGYQAVNVEAQEEDRHSLLNWLKRMLAVRREHQAFGRGTQRFLRPANRRILAYLRELGDDVVLCVANLGQSAQAVELDLAGMEGMVPVEMLGGAAFPAIGAMPYPLTLTPYGFLWFRLSAAADAAAGDAPSWSGALAPVEAERFTFVLRPSLIDVVAGDYRRRLEEDILPGYLASHPRFDGVGGAIERVGLVRAIALPGTQDMLLAELAVTTAAGCTRHALPLGIAWEDEAQAPYAGGLALARVRRGRRVGLLTDGLALAGFAQGVLAAMAAGLVLSASGVDLRFEALAGFDVPADVEPGERSGHAVTLGESAILKLRRIEPAACADVGLIRHLADRGYAAVPAVLGLATRIEDGETAPMLLLQRFVPHQGDGWAWTLAALARLASDDRFTFANYATFARALGRRLAGMHDLLARPDGDAAFAPERID
ncbi:maltose alpha-D-glucosyltransferase, partial [Sphingomonas bacterium]|uniref:maltose alpha-D-glucosyltransferase n=1 Tax=Sphingomonas bacterium TaxID=1895847 RepID=UPI0015771653